LERHDGSQKGYLSKRSVEGITEVDVLRNRHDWLVKVF